VEEEEEVMNLEHADNLTVGLIVLLLIVITLLGRHITLSIGGIKAELKPNGGASLRDVVDRVEMATRLSADKAEVAAALAEKAAERAHLTLVRIEAQYPQHLTLDITTHQSEDDGTVQIEGEVT
jgi:hypothetical protein